MAQQPSSLRARNTSSTSTPPSEDPSLPASTLDPGRPIPKKSKLSTFTRISIYASILLCLYWYFLYRPHDTVGYDQDGDHLLNANLLSLIVNVTVHRGFTTTDTPHFGLLLRKNRIVRVFDSHNEARRTSYSLASTPGVTVVDGLGATVVPGLVDSHGHLIEYGLSLDHPDLSPATSLKEIRAILLNYVSGLPRGHFSSHSRWLRAHGWDQTKIAGSTAGWFPTSKDLGDWYFPMVLHRVDMHAYWVNDAALAMMKIPKRDPIGGVIVRDPSTGKPTGVFIDTAMSIVDRYVPALTPEVMVSAVHRAQNSLLRFGLTGVHVAGVLPRALDVLQEMDTDGSLAIRTYVMGRCPDTKNPRVPAKFPAFCPRAFPSGHVEGTLLTMRAIKLFVDGALGSRGAALLNPYTDVPTTRGSVLCSEWKCPELTHVIRRWTERGWQVAVHAIGDHATRVAVKAIIDAQVPLSLRPRIEHAQILRSKEIQLLVIHQIIPSIQPSQRESDMRYAEKRLGRGRIDHMYPWTEMVKSGIDRLAFGSDFPVESADPFVGLRGWDVSGLARGVALRGYTETAAYAAIMEEKVGRLDPGMLADLTVLDRDPGAANVKVLATVVDGVARYVDEAYAVVWQGLK